MIRPRQVGHVPQRPADLAGDVSLRQ